jgi:serine phosphatase RsbU (regulator of sigma subunit)
VVTDRARAQPPGLGSLMRELDRAAPTELVDVCGGWLARHVDAESCALLLADYSETTLELVPDTHRGGNVEAQYGLENGPAGRAFREQRVVRTIVPAEDQASRMLTVHYLPVSMRMDRLGVLVVVQAGEADSGQHTLLDEVAQVLAYVLTGARRYTDRFESLRRRRRLDVGAEIQWELLPVLAYELPSFSIAGALEPAYEIGGDTFDYAVSARSLTACILDAAGRGLRGAMLSSLALSAIRNVRRSGGSIVDQAQDANRHLANEFPRRDFVSGLLLDLDVSSGRGQVVNAGHLPPLLLRAGSVRSLDLTPAVPMGLFEDTRYVAHPVELRPGDRLLLVTDGIEEAHDPGQPGFGLDRIVDLLVANSGIPPVEFVRLLTKEVSEHRAEKLDDDATAVCLDWHPPTPTED